MKKDTSFSDDLLNGAGEIAGFLGPSFNARSVYYMWEKRKLKSLFFLNGKIRARKNSLRREVSEESAA